MKVMAIAQNTSGTEPGEENVALILQGLREFKQDSRTEAVYTFAGLWAGVVICNVDSAEELDQYLELNPGSKFIEWELHNVSTLDERINTLELLQKHRSARHKAA